MESLEVCICNSAVEERNFIREYSEQDENFNKIVQIEKDTIL